MPEKNNGIMLSQASAQSLMSAGLSWNPQEGDQFLIPEREMDSQRFTLSEMAVIPVLVKGVPAVSFHGTPEWALDYVHLDEVLWLPDETRLREELKSRLQADGSDVFDLMYADGEYLIRFEWHGRALAFRAAEAEEAYAGALIHVLSAWRSEEQTQT
jgi:hypothetical protein